MTMTLPASPPAPAGLSWSERIFCGVVALIGLVEAGSAVIDLLLIGNIAVSPDLSPRGLVKLALMVLHLALALAATGFAVTGRLRFGVAALAVWALVRWAWNLTIFGWFSVSPEADAFNFGLALFTTFGQPLLCAAALAAAWRNRHLGAATIAMAALTLFDLGAITTFAIVLSVYGYGP